MNISILGGQNQSYCNCKVFNHLLNFSLVSLAILTEADSLISKQLLLKNLQHVCAMSLSDFFFVIALKIMKDFKLILFLLFPIYTSFAKMEISKGA
jgi:hypothetical protein